ncbi:MAG: hypothetical protein Q8L46_01485 [candidate division WWE3 bacterium]|nr:hypothetical protein [candidate division WWE3 bacterium]
MGYVYFASYVTWRLTPGGIHQEFANEEVALPYPITSIAQIREAEGIIGEVGSIVILFYQFLREDFEEKEEKAEEETAIPLPLFDTISAN